MRMLILFISLLVSISFSAFAGNPEFADGFWYYRGDQGNLLKDEFVTVDGNTYYFGSDGRLCSDCLITKDGNRYGLEENGTLIRSRWKKIFVKDRGESRWMYFGYDGRAFSDGWLSDGGGRYHFTDGCMDHGWFTDEEGAVYYLGDANDGKAHTGWFVWKGGDETESEAREHGWYYFSTTTGKMTSGKEIVIGSETYAFTEKGTQAAGFCIIETNGVRTEKYYDPATGKRASGWLYVGTDSETEEHPSGWYYFVEGVPLSPSFHTIKISDSIGTASIDGTFYAFDSNGKMLVGLIETGNGNKYFFDTDGRMCTGYICINPGSNSEEYLYFETQGTSPPTLGCTVTGARGDYVYDHGVRLSAETEPVESVTIETGSGKRTYIVTIDGRIRKNGTVRMNDGRLMRICCENGSYYLQAR